jgi:DNA-binding NtrC family response regulator
MNRSLLIIEDDPQVLGILHHFFTSSGWTVARATDGRMGIESYERDLPSIVVLDLEMPGLSGMQVLQILLARDPDATVIILTGNGDIGSAVQAMQHGAENFLTKPIDRALLAAATERAAEKAALKRLARFFAEKQRAGAGDLGTMGSSPQMQALRREIELLAPGSAPILLTGETGSGKGWAAKLVHGASPRSAAPFVEVNCAGLSATFLDSELFGHEKGAFTDAKTQKLGLFEIANGGTLFLDEIGDLAPELQPKLLKVLESQRFRRLGGTREIEVDVRLVAATHHDLQLAVAEGRFRQDLYYRLAVLPLRLPPLRERGREEIVELATRLLAELRARIGRGPTRFAPETLGLLVRYDWPGNVRELRNILERVVLLAAHADELRPEHLPADLRANIGPDQIPDDEDLTLEAVEKRHIARVLLQSEGNRAAAARTLGVTRATLYKKLKAYDLELLDRSEKSASSS